LIDLHLRDLLSHPADASGPRAASWQEMLLAHRALALRDILNLITEQHAARQSE
jgi:hypothetical protein